MSSENPVTLKIDGKALMANPGEKILSVARRNGIPIPTLCFHEAIKASGGCRLCVVESLADGKSKLVNACVFPAKDGMDIQTCSDAVMASRRETIAGLLARCPETPLVRDLAAEYGVGEPSGQARPNPDDCVACGLCVRVCKTLGHAALAFEGKGLEKKVVSANPDACVGCASCAKICPTGAISFTEGPSWRDIWGQRFDLTSCASCGRAVLPRKQADHVAATAELPGSYFEICDECRRRETADKFASIVNW